MTQHVIQHVVQHVAHYVTHHTYHNIPVSPDFTDPICGEQAAKFGRIIGK